MRDVLSELMQWWEAGETIGVGTVVATFRSAPRPPGASMLVGPDETAVGSVSGGCVEGAVYELAQSVVSSGEPVLERYGVSDDDAFAVGLTCGGILDVFVEKVSRETFPELGDIAEDVRSGRPVALATVVEDPGHAVFVALWDVNETDVALLDDWEGVDIGLYRKVHVRVSTLDGEQLAWLYVLDGYEGGLPSALYVGMLADAAEASGAPADYVAGLRALPCRSVG